MAPRTTSIFRDTTICQASLMWPAGGGCRSIFRVTCSHITRIACRGYGSSFKQNVRKMQPGYLQMGSFAKVTAGPENQVTVDPARLDANGIPIPVVRFRFSQNDQASLETGQPKHAGDVFPLKGQGLLHLRRCSSWFCKPRGGYDSHGKRSSHLGAQWLLSGARGERIFSSQMAAVLPPPARRIRRLPSWRFRCGRRLH